MPGDPGSLDRVDTFSAGAVRRQLGDESARRAQPGQGNRDQAPNRGLGRYGARCCERLEAVVRELVRRDIVPELACRCTLGQQVSDEVVKLALRPGDMLSSMQERREFGAMVPMLNERVRLEHGLELLASRAGLIPDFDEVFEVGRD